MRVHRVPVKIVWRSMSGLVRLCPSRPGLTWIWPQSMPRSRSGKYPGPSNFLRSVKPAGIPVQRSGFFFHLCMAWIATTARSGGEKIQASYERGQAAAQCERRKGQERRRGASGADGGNTASSDPPLPRQPSIPRATFSPVRLSTLSLSHLLGFLIFV